MSVRTCIRALNREGEFANLSTEVLLELASKFAVKAIPQQIDMGEMNIGRDIYIIAPQNPQQRIGNQETHQLVIE